MCLRLYAAAHARSLGFQPQLGAARGWRSSSAGLRETTTGLLSGLVRFSCSARMTLPSWRRPLQILAVTTPFKPRITAVRFLSYATRLVRTTYLERQLTR